MNTHTRYIHKVTQKDVVKLQARVDRKRRQKVPSLALSRVNKAAFNLCRQTDRDTQTALMRSSKAS